MAKPVFSNAETGSLCAQLSYFMHAGIGSADALALAADDEPDAEHSKRLREMADRSDEGELLSQVMEQSGLFPDYVSKMVAVGERSGRTEEALEALRENSESRAALDRHIKSALLYPSILLMVMLAVVAVLLIYVLPIFNDVYSQLGSGLTGVAGALLAVGRALGRISPLLVAVFVAIGVFLILFSTNEMFRNAVFKAWQDKHGDKGLAYKVNTARFAQAFSMAMNSGLPADEAVEAAAEVLGENKVFIAKKEKCLQMLDEGAELREALRDSGLFPASECRMLEAGIRGGAGDRAVRQIAESLTLESDSALEDAVSRIEPAMITVTSVIVGLILLSVMLPLVNIMSAIG